MPLIGVKSNLMRCLWMSDWVINSHTNSKLSFSDAVLIEALPGIGDVGKIAGDYLLEQLDATLLFSFFSYDLPNSVFVNEDNVVELPKIEIYHSKVGDKDFLFLVGDVQPSSSNGCFAFCESILKLVSDLGCKSVVTLGGIGLSDLPLKPVVYCTGSDSSFVKRFLDKGAKDDVYGVVGPIVGVSGLLVGLASRFSMSGVVLLSETLNHPMFLGLKAARSILKVLNKVFPFSVDFKELNKEIRMLDKEMSSGDEVSAKIVNKLKKFRGREASYIG